jgi:hypothetical protein
MRIFGTSIAGAGRRSTQARTAVHPLRVESTDVGWPCGIDAELERAFLVCDRRHEQPTLTERNEAPVEQRISVRCEQQPVLTVETLVVRREPWWSSSRARASCAHGAGARSR